MNRPWRSQELSHEAEEAKEEAKGSDGDLIRGLSSTGLWQHPRRRHRCTPNAGPPDASGYQVSPGTVSHLLDKLVAAKRQAAPRGFLNRSDLALILAMGQHALPALRAPQCSPLTQRKEGRCRLETTMNRC